MGSYIFVSGGVISGLGKGVTSAALGAVLKRCGYRVTIIKCDAYLNVDAGTIRPQEHGEVFVTEDGMETDQDLGHYERFLNEPLSKENYMTNGQIYWEIIKRERNFEYNGEDVEVVPHVPEEIIRRIKLAEKTKKADITIVEIGGTVGEYQNILFLEANRIMKFGMGENVIHVHVGYLPIPKHLGEMKTKPIQTSVRMLNETGVQPDFIVARSENEMDDIRKSRIAWLCNVSKESIISNPDCKSVYEIPLIFARQNFHLLVLKKLGLKIPPRVDFSNWEHLEKKIKSQKERKIKIAVVGKYFGIGDYSLGDVYISVLEAIKHASWEKGVDTEISWIDSIQFENGKLNAEEVLKDFHGVVVPGGFGKRGVEGIILAIKYARENNVPYLGLCYGMQLAVIEFARNVCGMREANTTEVDENTKFPVIDILLEQKKLINDKKYGGTMRLGNYEAFLKNGSLVREIYKKESVFERHRHRYEVNPNFCDILQQNGMVFSGMSKNSKLVEFIELPEHPFFVGTQAHPEFNSRPESPHPLFLGFVDSAIKVSNK